MAFDPPPSPDGTVVYDAPTDAIADAAALPPDSWGAAAHVVAWEDSEDVIDVDLWEMLSEGLRVWDFQAGGLYRRLLAAPAAMMPSFMQKAWKLMALVSADQCPPELLDYLAEHVGFSRLDETTAALTGMLSDDQKRLLIKIAMKFWRRRGRLDLLSELITTFAAKIRPRIISCWWTLPRIDVLTIGSDELPASDFYLGHTEILDDDGSSDLNNTYIRVGDAVLAERPLIEALAELCRPSFERYTISYVHFIDTFIDGRAGHWKTRGAPPTYVAGNSSAVPPTIPTLLLAPGGHEEAATAWSSTWRNYVLSFGVTFEDAASKLGIRVLSTDDDNYVQIEIGTESFPGYGTLEVTERFAGVETYDGTTPNRFNHPNVLGVVIDIVSMTYGAQKISITVDETWQMDFVAQGVTNGTVSFINLGASSVGITVPEVYEKPLTTTVLE